MQKIKLFLFIGLVGLTSCGPTIKNDKSIGEVEAKTYTYLMDSITKAFKRQFNGNMYESEKITPVVVDGVDKIEIPNGMVYTFQKDNSKFIKGDLNNDKKTDLIICAYMVEGRGQEVRKYFVFLQGDEKHYNNFTELQGDDMVLPNCSNGELKDGNFNLDSISNGLLIGTTDYRSTHESYYLNHTYRCAGEKYKLNIATKQSELVSMGDMLKKDDKTGEYVKTEMAMPEVKK